MTWKYTQANKSNIHSIASNTRVSQRAINKAILIIKELNTLQSKLGFTILNDSELNDVAFCFDELTVSIENSTKAKLQNNYSSIIGWFEFTNDNENTNDNS